MKSKTPDQFLSVRKLVKKLGELANVLDDVSRKMHHAVEKQKQTLGKIDKPSREERRILNNLHKKLESIEGLTIEDMELQQAQEISNTLLGSNARRQRSTRMTYHEYVEFSGVEEFERFRGMPAITDEELTFTDWEDLYERLAKED